MRFRCVTAIAAFSVTMLASEPCFAQEILFSEAFRTGTLGGSTVVQIPEGSILVFDGGEHILGGRDLVIYAQRAVIRSSTTVRSYAASDVPPSAAETPPLPPGISGQVPCGGRNGCDGVKGNVGLPGSDVLGQKGQSGGKFVLEVKNLTNNNNATLLILGQGQKGGRGQQGGQGGRGAEGGRGANATGLPSCRTPGRGGVGGPGGPPGRGGQGGQGGTGASILASPDLINLATAGSYFKIDVSGGPGGEAGPVGPAGIGGAGGPRGSGSRTCSHSPPGPAPDGPDGPATPPPGQVTPPSVSGANGQVLAIKE